MTTSAYTPLCCSFCGIDISSSPFWMLKDTNKVACVLCVPNAIGKKKAEDFDRAMGVVK